MANLVEKRTVNKIFVNKIVKTKTTGRMRNIKKDLLNQRKRRLPVHTEILDKAYFNERKLKIIANIPDITSLRVLMLQVTKSGKLEHINRLIKFLKRFEKFKKYTPTAVNAIVQSIKQKLIKEDKFKETKNAVLSIYGNDKETDEAITDNILNLFYGENQILIKRFLLYVLGDVKNLNNYAFIEKILLKTDTNNELLGTALIAYAKLNPKRAMDFIIKLRRNANDVYRDNSHQINSALIWILQRLASEEITDPDTINLLNNIIYIRDWDWELIGFDLDECSVLHYIKTSDKKHIKIRGFNLNQYQKFVEKKHSDFA